MPHRRCAPSAEAQERPGGIAAFGMEIDMRVPKRCQPLSQKPTRIDRKQSKLRNADVSRSEP